MASINSKKREADKLLPESLKSQRLLKEANILKNETKLREEFENFQGKGFKLIKRNNH